MFSLQSRRAWFIAAVLCAAIFGVAHSFDAVAQAERINSRFDTDGDGALNFEEFQSAMAVVFDRLDHNKDGKLTLTELVGKSGKKDSMEVWLTEARLSAVDKNGDEVWTRKELLDPEALKKLFTHIDINADKRITADELRAGWLGGQALLAGSSP